MAARADGQSEKSARGTFGKRKGHWDMVELPNFSQLFEKIVSGIRTDPTG